MTSSPLHGYPLPTDPMGLMQEGGANLNPRLDAVSEDLYRVLVDFDGATKSIGMVSIKKPDEGEGYVLTLHHRRGTVLDTCQVPGIQSGILTLFRGGIAPLLGATLPNRTDYKVKRSASAFTNVALLVIPLQCLCWANVLSQGWSHQAMWGGLQAAGFVGYLLVSFVFPAWYVRHLENSGYDTGGQTSGLGLLAGFGLLISALLGLLGLGFLAAGLS